ncbi:hypothetical protein HDU85_006077 [Gaertneriomyces sp. JEL0708]|nr:hypothetical protein HDU85_006077 [Gaertneriomyces sp. JEL0708]
MSTGDFDDSVTSVTSSEGGTELEDLQDLRGKPPPPPSSLFGRIRHYVLNHISAAQARDTIKLSVTFLLSLVIVLIRPIGRAIGPDAYVLPLAQMYFPPVVTIGAMIETTVIGAIGCCIGAGMGFVAQASVAALNQAYVRRGHDPTSKAGGPILLGFWFLWTMFIFAFFRAKYPRTSNAYVLMSIQVIYVMTSGSYDTEIDPSAVLNVLKPLLCGGAVSMVGNLLVWPKTGAGVLRDNLTPLLAALQTHLDLSTACLASASSPDFVASLSQQLPAIQLTTKAALQYLSQVEGALNETRSEFSIGRYPPGALRIVVRHLRTMVRLLEGIGRGYQVMSEIVESQAIDMAGLEETHGNTVRSAQSGFFDENGQPQFLHTYTLSPAASLADGHSEINGPFGGNMPLLLAFLQHIAGSLSTLTDNCTTRLEGITSVLISPSAAVRSDSLHYLSAHPSQLPAFDKTYEKSVAEFFKKKEFAGAPPVREECFLLFYLSFNVRELALAVDKLEAEVKRLHVEKFGRRRIWFPGVGFTNWLREEQEFAIGGIKPPNWEKSSKTDVRGYNRRSKVVRWIKDFEKFWHTAEARFGVKTSLALLALALPGLLNAQWYHDVRAVWALVSFGVVNSPSVGASLRIGLYRLIGTLTGAASAIVVWVIAPANPYVMAVLSFILALPGTWIYLHTRYLRIGVTALFTYALVLLAAWIQADPEKTSKPGGSADDIYSYAWKRSVTIAVGVIAAVVVNILIWPYKARVHLRTDIASLIHHLSSLYTSQAILFLTSPTSESAKQLRVQTLSTAHHSSIRARRLLSHARTLLPFADTEHIITPFPSRQYDRLISALQQLHVLLTSMTRMGQTGFGKAREWWILPVSSWRRDVWSTGLGFLSVIGASLRGNVPLPVILPPVRSVRLRLIARLNALPHEGFFDSQTTEETTTTGQWFYYFAWAQATEFIIEEMEKIGNEVAGVVGKDNVAQRLFGLDEFKHDGPMQ